MGMKAEMVYYFACDKCESLIGTPGIVSQHALRTVAEQAGWKLGRHSDGYSYTSLCPSCKNKKKGK